MTAAGMDQTFQLEGTVWHYFPCFNPCPSFYLLLLSNFKPLSVDQDSTPPRRLFFFSAMVISDSFFSEVYSVLGVTGQLFHDGSEGDSVGPHLSTTVLPKIHQNLVKRMLMNISLTLHHRH